MATLFSYLQVQFRSPFPPLNHLSNPLSFLHFSFFLLPLHLPLPRLLSLILLKYKRNSECPSKTLTAENPRGPCILSPCPNMHTHTCTRAQIHIPFSAGCLITTPISLTSDCDVIMGPTLACCRAQPHRQHHHPLAVADEPRMGRSWTVRIPSSFAHACVCVLVCV